MEIMSSVKHQNSSLQMFSVMEIVRINSTICKGFYLGNLSKPLFLYKNSNHLFEGESPEFSNPSDCSFSGSTKRHSTPATLVWLDQHYHLGMTPLPSSLWMSINNHKVETSSPGYFVDRKSDQILAFIPIF